MRYARGKNWPILMAAVGVVVLGVALLMLFTGGDPLRLLRASSAPDTQQLTRPQPPTPRSIPVKTAPVRRGDLEHRIGFTGDIVAEASVQVFSKVAGVLEELSVERGDRVSAGQPLGRIEWRELEAHVDQARAQVARYRAQYAQLEAGARPEEIAQARDRVRKAKAALDHMKRTLDRTKELVERAFIPPQELDNATAAYQSALAEHSIAQDSLALIQQGAREEDRQAAKAQVQGAEAALRLAQVQLGYTMLLASIAGVVAERHVDRGAFVTLSTPVVTIMAMDRVRIVGRVSERDLGTLRLGQRAELRVDAYPDAVFIGEVTQISPTVYQESRTVELELTVDNPDHRLKPGMFGHISLIVEVHRNVLLVPRVAVRSDGSGEKIFILNERSAHARPVTTGFTTDHWAVVLDNVQAGEEVIVAGQDHLTDGSPVIVIRDGGVTEGGKR